MPSDDSLLHFQDHLHLEDHWRVSGLHYKKTDEAWLRRLDSRAKDIRRLFKGICGAAEARRWLQR